MSRVTSERGFTLVELMVAIVMATIVLGAAVTAYVSFLTQSAKSDRRANSQDAARRAMDAITTQLRSAMATNQSGNQPIEDIRDYSITYLAPYPNAVMQGNPLGLQHVRYCLSISTTASATLWRQTAPYNNSSKTAPPASGTATCPSSAYTTQVPVVQNLVNQLLTPAVPFFTPTTDSSGSVTDVGMRAYVNVDTSKDKAVNLQSSVTLRNLNHRPTATISCNGASNGHVICDASGSTDQDNQTLSFQWSVDGAVQTETSYRLDKSGLVSGSTHTYSVTVTDTGGLTNSASATVTTP